MIGDISQTQHMISLLPWVEYKGPVCEWISTACTTMWVGMKSNDPITTNVVAPKGLDISSADNSMNSGENPLFFSPNGCHFPHKLKTRKYNLYVVDIS